MREGFDLGVLFGILVRRARFEGREMEWSKRMESW